MKKRNPKKNWTSPRSMGMREQYARARRFLQAARRCKRPETRFRHLIAAIYPARAVAELMLESARKQELVAFKSKDIERSRKDCESKLAPRLPHYNLIEKIRIHDFHRFGCLPPSSDSCSVFYGGPAKLKPRKGTAAMLIAPAGPKLISTGTSSIEEQRSLCSSDGMFFDDEVGCYVDLESLLAEYLDGVSAVLAEFGAEWAG